MEKGKVIDNIIESIGSFVSYSMRLFGQEVNTKRQLPSIWDGLKPAYRHVIFEEMKTGTQMRKSADIAGSCISTTHGHGDASLREPISNLVRWGISKGQGNHGKKMMIGEDTDPSAMRYTEVRLSDKYLGIFSELMPYVPYIQSEIKGTEPEYLPTPVPLVLTHGSLGVGLGVNCRIPAFTVKSMMAALMEDNPYLLEAPFGLEIDIDKSELDKLWETGVGKICYKFKVTTGYCEGTWGTFIEGQPELFKPSLSKIEKWVTYGKAFMIDLTTGSSTKIFVAREKGIKSVSDSDIKEQCLQASENTRTYRLTVADRDQVYLIPLREWLKFTYENYLSIIEKYRTDKINKASFDYKVYEALPNVVKVLYDNRDYTPNQISNELNIELEVVKSVLSKSISMLRKTDTTEKLNKISSEIEGYKSLVPTEFVSDIIDEF